MMGALAWRHLLPPKVTGGQTIEAEELTSDWQDVEEWMQILIGGKPAGLALVSVQKIDSGYKANSSVKLTMAALPKPLQINSVAQLNEEFHLNAFWLTGTASPLSLDVRGIVWDDKLLIKVDTTPGGDPKRGYFPLKQPIVLMDSLRPLAARKMELKDGAVYRFPAFDPIWSGIAGEAVVRVLGTEDIKVGGVERPATKIETTLAGQKVTAWVDETHAVLRYEFANNIVFERISRLEGLQIDPSFERQMDAPRFAIEDFTQGQQLIDLSKQSPMSIASEILFGAASPRP